MKHSYFTVLLAVLISMVGAQAFSQICIIEYDGLYYSVDDNQGTARLVNIEEEFPDLMNTIYSYDAPSGDIVIPEEILVPAYDDYTYTHSFNTISVIEGDFLGWYNHNSFQVISIGQAFRENGAIKSVTIPSSITSIGDEAFEGCYGLTSVNFGDGVKSIGNSAFKWCSSLLSVVIPYGVTSIGDDAFWNCYSLTSVYIPCSVTNIGDDAFYWCSSLTSVSIESDAPIAITENTFSNRANATLSVPLGYTKAYQKADYWKEFRNFVSKNYNIRFVDPEVKTLCVSNWDTNADGELSLSEAAAVASLGEVFQHNGYNVVSFNELRFFKGLTSIEEYAFSRCSKMTSVFIPANVTNISARAFENKLETIKVDLDNTVYDSREDCNAIIETRTNKLVIGCSKTSIPNDIKAIGNFAFYDCNQLTSISIPTGITSIGEFAFESTGLTQVNLPNSVSNIGCNAFRYTPWEENQPDGLIYAGKVAYKYKGTMPQNTSITIKEGTIGIAGRAFDGYSNLVSVSIPNTVTNIGNYAFYGCGLTAVSIPNSVTSMGYGVFSDTPWLNSQPNGMIYLGKIAYMYKGTMPNNTSFAIQEGTVCVAGSAFYGMSGLVSVTIPQSVLSIGEMAFTECTNLTSITIEKETPITLTANLVGNPSNVTLYVPARCAEEYQNAIFWSNFTDIREMAPPASVSITMATASGTARTMIGYSSRYGLDFTGINDVKAYIAVMFTKDYVTYLSRIYVVPPYTGVVLRTETPGITVDVPTTDEDVYVVNMLQPAVSNTTINPTETIEGVEYGNLMVGKISGTETMGFVKFNNPVVRSNNCYLRVPIDFYNALASAPNMDGLSVVFDDDETTDIRSIDAIESPADDRVYDLQGRPVTTAKKGLVIKNGKLVFVKP